MPWRPTPGTGPTTLRRCSPHGRRDDPRPPRRGREYHLTAAGEELRALIDCLGEWGQRWARAQIGRDDLDAGLLMWDIHRRVNLDALPSRRVVVRFDFRVGAVVAGHRAKGIHENDTASVRPIGG